MKKTKQFLGLKRLPKKGRERDFKFGVLGAYKPLHDVFELPKTRIMTQFDNVCTFYSRAGAKEVDEKMALNPQTIVKIGKKLGLISGNGFANLRTPQLIVKDSGIGSEEEIPETNKGNWSVYSKYDLTNEQLELMKKHKSNTFWSADTCLEAIKALDEGHAVCFGVDWLDTMNNLGGDFILNFSRGTRIGGHAMKICGYDMTKGLLKVQNSFGENWRDAGYCYIRFADFNKQVGKYGAYYDQDIPRTTAEWLIANNGKILKEKNGVKCYFLENGKARLFEDEFVLWAYNKRLADIETDEEDMLPQIEKGEPFVFEYGQRAQDLKEIMRGMDSGRLTELGHAYFPEFFK